MAQSPNIVAGESTKPLLLHTLSAPFSPPRRSSSLALGTSQRSNVAPLHTICYNDQLQVGTISHCAEPTIQNRTLSGPLPPHGISSQGYVNVTQMQRIFQSARANVHRDMFRASSPGTSIESRMCDLSSSGICEELSPRFEGGDQEDVNTKSWRYSTIPLSLAAITADVREPLPSPTLPDPPAPDLERDSGGIEPASSGFTSPSNMTNKRNTFIEATMSALPPSRPLSTELCTWSDGAEVPSRSFMTECTDLGQSLAQLRVSAERYDSDSSQDSPIVRHLQRQSRGTSMDVDCSTLSEHSIYLSKTADAAAQSARFKRGLLKRTPEVGAYIADRAEHDLPQMSQPLHPNKSTMPCPDPSLHTQSPQMLRRPTSALSKDVDMMSTDSSPFGQRLSTFGASHTVSTGSPITFARARSQPRTGLNDHGFSQTLPSSYRQNPPYMSTNHEYFRPGWYHVQDSGARPAPRPTYSFSTAASKIVGSDQAPDSRIRDSYKTDTLTALARPANRYRKTGIGAEMGSRGVSRYYQRPQSAMRPPGGRWRPGSKQSYISTTDVRFQSSPPRAPGLKNFVPACRKRTIDDSFVIAEDLPDTSNNAPPTFRLHASDEVMEVDQQTKAAVRLSIFGANTPEALRKARQSIQELSPNIQVFRKGTQEHGHLRKKRRPSYWDSDLKEVKESPAGRGGVNSPASAQASMRAEVEVASIGNTDTNVDEGVPPQRLSELK